ncbi:hypothetical protein SAMN02927921_02050 [Sinomicrobium oceani]|uniref:Uncharacterized protein n=1 Tax=Sinomicrobium oceani TaxID=1150368 RepID=A0A1K1PVK1_9FLAO|nr:hypothetical protein SAMN02927921_02050 [Sinomicrobium oceani]
MYARLYLPVFAGTLKNFKVIVRRSFYVLKCKFFLDYNERFKDRSFSCNRSHCKIS